MMRRILVIHPKLLVRNALVFSLQHSGFHVVGASSGEEALTEVNSGHLDVIVVAESSHRLNGDELLHSHSSENPFVSFVTLLVKPAKAYNRSVEGIGIFHGEFPNP